MEILFSFFFTVEGFKWIFDGFDERCVEQEIIKLSSKADLQLCVNTWNV